MTHISHIFAALLGIAVCASAADAQAGCIAEYKAKRDDPLELYYEMAPVTGPCTLQNAEAQLRAALEAQGLTLLKVLSVTES